MYDINEHGSAGQALAPAQALDFRRDPLFASATGVGAFIDGALLCSILACALLTSPLSSSTVDDPSYRDSGLLNVHADDPSTHSKS